MSRQNPMEITGGTVIAMTGKNCFCIGSDLRLGDGMLTVEHTKSKVYSMGDHLYVGLAGLATDCQTMLEKLKFRKNLYELRENRMISPKVFSKMLSSLQYEKRFGSYFVNPIVAGLSPVTFEPYLCAMDTIGCMTEPKDFVVTGTAELSSCGMAETVWRPDMEPEEVFEATAQSLLAALDRTANSGWGAVIHTVTPGGVKTRTLRGRMD